MEIYRFLGGNSGVGDNEELSVSTSSHLMTTRAFVCFCCNIAEENRSV